MSISVKPLEVLAKHLNPRNDIRNYYDLMEESSNYGLKEYVVDLAKGSSYVMGRALVRGGVIGATVGYFIDSDIHNAITVGYLVDILQTLGHAYYDNIKNHRNNPQSNSSDN